MKCDRSISSQFTIPKILSVAILGLAAGLVSCSINQSDRLNMGMRNRLAIAQEKPIVVASHNIICDLVKTIARDTVDTICLIDSSQDPHTYRPTPSQRQVMEKAQLILYGGYELEPKIIDLVEATEIPASKIAVYETVVTEPIVTEHHHDTEVHEDHEQDRDGDWVTDSNTESESEADPHVWHNVENAVAMVEVIQSALLQINPNDAALYLQNNSNLTEKFWQLDTWIKEQVTTIPQGKKVLVTNHETLNYYVQAYGFDDYLTLQGSNSDETATASKLRQLTMQIRQIGIPTIFSESTASDRVINSLAREAKVKLAEQKLFADGLGEAETYVEMMEHNTCTIVNGLGGDCIPLTP